MPKPLPSDSLEAAIRAHFGLTQQELARYLGISRALLTHFEMGRRQSTLTVSKRLHWLADLLPPPDSNGPVPPNFTPPPLPTVNAELLLTALPSLGPLPSATLRKRQRQVTFQAVDLRYKLQKAGKRAAHQQRRQWALAVLQAAPPPSFATTADQYRFEHWLHSLAADVSAASPTPANTAAHALAVVRMLTLEAEVALLARLLQLTGTPELRPAPAGPPAGPTAGSPLA
jgi:transcriptional regulator with XRE-family HTH domain